MYVKWFRYKYICDVFLILIDNLMQNTHALIKET